MEQRAATPSRTARLVLITLVAALLVVGYLLLMQGALTGMGQLYPALTATSHLAPLVVGLVFVGGVASGLSPCYVPILTMFAGYVGGYARREEATGLRLGVPFVVGNALTLALVGGIAALFGRAILQLFTGYQLDRWIPDFIGLIVGLQLLGLVRLPMPVIPALRSIRRPGTVRGALALGLPFGLVVTPCTIPIFVAVITLVAFQANVAAGVLLMVAYALGRGLILLAVAVFAGLLKAVNFGRATWYVERLSGALILIVSVGLLVFYDAFIRFTMGLMAS